MRKILSLSLLSFLALGLVGCRALWHPGPMPTGYTYHAEEFKAVPDLGAYSIGYDYSTAKNDEVLEIFHIVAADLVDQLEEQTGLSPQGIYIHSHADQGAFFATYDHVLRDTLRERGYKLATYPNVGLELWYEAHRPVDITFKEHHRTPAEQKDFLLILTLADDGAFFGKAAGVYRVPGYDFEIGSTAPKFPEVEAEEAQ